MSTEQHSTRRTTAPRLAGLASGLALALALGSGAAAAAEEEVLQLGQQSYVDYCGACHGRDAKGKGPVANLLTKSPSDLTMLAKNNDGAFPFMDVYDMIDGRDMPRAHGTPQMPVWGAEWKRKGTLGAETALRGRLLEIILYLRSVQQ